MPTNQEILDTWSERFAQVDVSKELLREALQIRPENAGVDFLYKMCCATKKASPRFKFTQAWELVMFTGDLDWVTKQLETAVEQPNNPSKDSLAHFAVLTRNVPCILAVLRKFPALKDTKNHYGYTLQYYTAHNYPGVDFNFNDVLNRVNQPWTIAEYRDLIMSGEGDWEKALLELKQYADIKSENAEKIYRECVTYHVERLKRLLKADNTGKVFKTLEKLANAKIAEAMLVVNAIYGQQALSEALRLIALPIAKQTFLFWNPQSRRQAEIIEQLEKAKELGNVSAYFYLGQFYCQHVLREDKFEKAFSYYYQGALLGDKRSLVELYTAAEMDKANADEHYYGSLYLGLVLKNKGHLEEAQNVNENGYQTFALQHSNDKLLAGRQRLLLLKVALNKAPNEVSIQKYSIQQAIMEIIQAELRQSDSAQKRLDFALACHQVLGDSDFINIAITLSDQILLPKECRLAMLLIAAKTTPTNRIIAAHLTAMPNDLKNSYNVILETIYSIAEEHNQSSSSSTDISPPQVANSSSSSTPAFYGEAVPGVTMVANQPKQDETVFKL